MADQPNVEVGCRLVAEFVDQAEVPTGEARFARRVSDPAAGEPLSAHERAVLLALVAESRGLGWGVVVAPFVAGLGERDIEPVDASLAVAGLQQKGLVALDEQAGWDAARNRPALEPVYRVTAQGFSTALRVRAGG